MPKTHVSREMKTWNHAAIRAWENELASLPGEIKHLESRLGTERKKEEVLEQERQRLLGQIAPLDVTLLNLTSRINVLTLPPQIKKLQQEIAPLQKALNPLLPRQAELQKSLESLEAEREQIEIQIKITQLEKQHGLLSQTLVTENALLDSDTASLPFLQSTRSQIHTELTIKRDLLTELQSTRAAKANSRARHVSMESGFLTMHHQPPVAEPNYFERSVRLQAEIQEMESRWATLNSEVSRLEKSIPVRRRTIQSTEQELRELESDLKIQRARITTSWYFSTPNEATLARKKNEIAPVVQRLKALNSEIEGFQKPLNKLERKLETLQSNYEAGVQNSGYSSVDNLESLQNDRATTQAERDKLQGDASAIEKQIKTQKNTLRVTNEELSSRRGLLSRRKNNTFLLTLRDNPRKLFDDLVTLAEKTLHTFDKSLDCPLPVDMRLCLADTLDKLDHIRLQAPAETPDEIRDQYYALSGMLCEALDWIDDKGYAAMADIFLKILDKHLVNEQDAKTVFNTLKTHDATLAHRMTQHEFEQRELKRFDAACQALSDTLARIPNEAPKVWRDLRQQGTGVLADIKAYRQKSRSRGDMEFDATFFTRVIEKTKQVTCEPRNLALRQEHTKLTQQIPVGQSSLLQKIVGGLFMFIGAATAAASITLQVLSFGLATPVTYAGMALGGALFTTGIGLFASSGQRGIPKKCNQFEAAAKRILNGNYADFVPGEPEDTSPSCPEMPGQDEVVPPPAYSPGEEPDNDEAWYPPTLSSAGGR